MAKDSSGAWSRVAVMRPGPAQYKILVDGTRYITDPANPATVDNYNRTSRNSVFVLTEGGDVLLTAVPPMPVRNTGDVYPPRTDRKPVFLNIIWHQHQPLYLDPATDQLGGPWVRTHATKDYYDMAAMLREYPDIHCTLNLTSSLLRAARSNTTSPVSGTSWISGQTVWTPRGFLKKWAGKTDPWIDLALKPAEKFDRRDRDLLYRNSWNAFGISPVQIERFPEYLALRKKLDGGQAAPDDLFTVAEQREIKFWFYCRPFRSGLPPRNGHAARWVDLRFERSAPGGERQVLPSPAGDGGRLQPDRGRVLQGHGQRRSGPPCVEARPTVAEGADRGDHDAVSTIRSCR